MKQFLDVIILKLMYHMNLNLIIGLIIKMYINIKKKLNIQNFMKINHGSLGY